MAIRYKVVVHRYPLNEFDMNQIASEGWRLVSAIHSVQTGNYSFYFEKIINSEPLVKG